MGNNGCECVWRREEEREGGREGGSVVCALAVSGCGGHKGSRTEQIRSVEGSRGRQTHRHLCTDTVCVCEGETSGSVMGRSQWNDSSSSSSWSLPVGAHWRVRTTLIVDLRKPNRVHSCWSSRNHDSNTLTVGCYGCAPVDAELQRI